MAFSLMRTISFVCLLVILDCTTSSLSSRDEECAALFHFKQSMSHQDGSENGSDDCCSWDGVACSEKGHVTGLDLSRSFLRGRINSSSTLFNLVHLQRLNLSMNDFLGSQIPSQIARLEQLRHLDLAYSGFSGRIPNEMSHLVRVSSLDLSGNSLTLHSPSLEYLLQNMTRLEELHLSGVDISSSVPRLLANLSSLTSIKLEDCHLRDEFPTKIFRLPKLKHLSMRYNSNLTGYMPEFRNFTLLEHLDLGYTSFSGIIPKSISNLNHLVLFSLSNCFVSGQIPGSLTNMTQLAHLFLDQNELTGRVPSLARLTNLITLKLSYNDFDKGIIPFWLSKLTNLEELYLSGMNIFYEIPPFLSNLTKLSVVQMRENFIVGRIPSSFTNLTQLTVIDLQRNQLQGPISTKFSNFKNLVILNLDHNNFSGRVDLDTFVGLDKLERLYINSNSVSFVENNNYTDGTLPRLEYLGLASCNLKEFPAFLRSQKNMVGLFLDENRIGGLVPVWIWNNSIETMQIIDLSFNFINGFHRAPNFLPWVRLEAFDISYNQVRGRMPIPPDTTELYDVSNNFLSGEIPPSICEVKSLRFLDLSSNNMTGTLPPCLGNLINSLLVLDLKQNHFHGTMMDTFASGSLLKRIDLSENRFTGQLPKSLTNCTNLEVLSLGDNSFDDVFPFWLGTLDELQVLILRSNKFHGAIQAHSTNGSSRFSKLRIIDLSNNGFSGQLPEIYFQSWNVMKSVSSGKLLAMNSNMQFDSFLKLNPYSMTLTNKGVKREFERILNIFTAIDLSCNNFEGIIPQSIQDLHGLESLNLSNNHLIGRILPSLGNLRNLESLDLSHNELSGEIPQQFLQLGFLAVLNVSFNHLDGRIPQGEQFNTFQNNSYMGNPRLCGEPLSKDCRTSKPSTPPPTGTESKSLLPSERVDWIVIFSGVVSGLVIGTIFGNSRSTRCSHWLIERLGMKKDRWVRPLRNTKRS